MKRPLRRPYRLWILRRLLVGSRLGLPAPARCGRLIRRELRRCPGLLPPTGIVPTASAVGSPPPPIPPLRIGLFTRWAFPHLGGLSTYLDALHQGLRQRGHQVTVIAENTLNGWPELRQRLRSRLGRGLRRLFRHHARRLVRREAELLAYTQLVRRMDLRAFDVLHAQDLFTANILMDLRPVHGRPIVYTPHGILSERRQPQNGLRPTRLTRLYRRVIDHIAASGADHVVVLSRHFARRLRRLGARPARLTVSPSGLVDPGLPSPLERVGREGPVTITYLGRMKSSKGPQLLLRALARIGRRAPPWRLQLIGDGPGLPGLRRLVRRLRLDGVTFYGRQDDVYRFLRRSDILVIPGLEETFPMAGIEGLFAGQAVLASRCGGLPEMIQHGETGWLFEPGDVAALARGLLRLMVDRELRLRLAVAGQQRAKAYFRLERMCMDLEAVYASLVGDVAT